MQYFGGKSKIAKEIVEILEYYRKPNQLYIEPFVGGGSVISKMSGLKMAFDKHHYLIAMYQALQNGWIPPDHVTEEDYKMAKNKELEDYEIGFIGFSCSYSGKWFGGYARNNRGDNYALQSKKSLLRKMDNLKFDTTFWECDYRLLKPENKLIYCDPPYEGTTKYNGVDDFNSNEFWEIMREWSKNNTVIISEYNAPDDFRCIWERKTNIEIRNKNNEREKRIERLFMNNG